MLEAVIKEDVTRALAEDIGGGDLTADLLPAEKLGKATVISREPAIVCGTGWVDEVFRQIEPGVKLH